MTANNYSLFYSQKDKEGGSDKIWTIQPLHFCLQKGLIRFFSILTFLGADWNVKDDEGKSAFDEFINFLQDDDDESGKRFCQMNILTKRWLLRDEEWLKLFAKALKFTRDAKCLDIYNQAKCLDILVQIKSSISDRVCDDFGNTALHLACEANETSLVEKIINKMTNVSIQNFKGK